MAISTYSTNFRGGIAMKFKRKWRVRVTESIMTGKKIWEVYSPFVKPIESLRFPYDDTKAQITVRFDGDIELVAIKFSDSCNVTGTTINKHDRLVTAAIRWDNKIEEFSLVQTRLSPYLVFLSASKVIDRLCTSQLMIIELDWYFDGPVHFKFDLTGVADLIWRAKKEALSQR